MLAERQSYSCYQHSPVILPGTESQVADTVTQTVFREGNGAEGLLRLTHTEGAGPGRVPFVPCSLSR